MSKHFVKTLSGVFLASSLFFTSCETTDSPLPTVTGPTVRLESGPSVLSADATVNANDVFTVQINAAQASSPLKVLTIQENGVNVPMDRLKVNGTAASSNPILLFNNDKTTFTYQIAVKAHADVSTKTYEFIVQDDAGRSSSQRLAITTKAVPLNVRLITGDSLSVAPNSLFSSKFGITNGSSTLKTLEIKENGTTIADLSRLSYQTLQNKFTANPFTLPTADQAGFDSRDILILTPATPGRYVYTYIFTDAAGQATSRNVVVRVGTPITLITGALLNAAGPDGTGGLDLNTGKGTGSLSSSADIRDEGIDAALSEATNWKQQVSGVNGSEIRYVVAGQNGVPASFTFAGVQSAEELPNLFNQGVAFTLKNGTRPVSNKLKQGDVLIVKQGSSYFLLIVKSIKITTTDNADQYTFDIKK